MTISLTFRVTGINAASLPPRLTGTANAPFQLQNLQIPTLVGDHLILKNTTQDSLRVTVNQQNVLINMPLPSTVVFTGEDTGTAIDVTSITVNGSPVSAMVQSDITALLEPPAATGTEDA